MEDVNVLEEKQCPFKQCNCDFTMELSLAHTTGSKVKTLRAGDVKSLLLKHEGLSSNPLHAHEKAGIKLMVMPLVKTTLT